MLGVNEANGSVSLLIFLTRNSAGFSNLTLRHKVHEGILHDIANGEDPGLFAIELLEVLLLAGKTKICSWPTLWQTMQVATMEGWVCFALTNARVSLQA